jgi:hypothetical protein
MGKVQNQRFYHIPFGAFIDSLKLFAGKCGLTLIDDLDEAYTSKTSSLSGDVCRAQEVLKDQDRYNAAVRSDVFSGKRVKRGLFCDGPTGQLIHGDINGSVNLVKLYFGRIKEFLTESWTEIPKFKLMNPRILGQKNALLSLLDRPFEVVLPGRGTIASQEAHAFKLKPRFVDAQI